MPIKSVKVSNFKSLKDLEVELGPFNVLIGANASGKSNFIEVFQFLKDIAKEGLENAISMHGGAESIINMKGGAGAKLRIQIALKPLPFSWSGVDDKCQPNAFEPFLSDYVFALAFPEESDNVQIVEEQLCVKGHLSDGSPARTPSSESGESGLVLKRYADRWETTTLPENSRHKELLKKFFAFMWPADGSVLTGTPTPGKLLMEQAFRGPWGGDDFREMGIFDFDVKKPKRAIPVSGKADLDPDAGNLAIVLKRILQDSAQAARFERLLRDVLPFLLNTRTQAQSDKSLLLEVKEQFHTKRFIPAFLISDGTIGVIALIVALFFEKNRITILEEPERSIHPHLMAKVMDLMRAASEKKQVIVTTHNPELVRHAGVENLLLVSRDAEGFTTVSRPADKERVKTFLENELGIEELFVDNLLEG